MVTRLALASIFLIFRTIPLVGAVGKVTENAAAVASHKIVKSAIVAVYAAVLIAMGEEFTATAAATNAVEAA
jgi:hypothetical protein